MTKKQLIETIRRVIKETVEENAPAPSKPKETPGPAVAPGKPGQKPGPRRPLGNPDVKPKPKATMKEADMLAKIVKRFRASKQMDESPKKTWAEGYEEGYNEGYNDSQKGRINKFTHSTKEAKIKKPEFKGFEKKFVPKNIQQKSLPKKGTVGIHHYDKNNPEDLTDINYLTDPYEKVSNVSVKKDD